MENQEVSSQLTFQGHPRINVGTIMVVGAKESGGAGLEGGEIERSERDQYIPLIIE